MAKSQAIWKDGHWEVEPGVRGESVPAPHQQMDLAERNRVIGHRLRYLEYMHDHFADRIVEPPEGTDEIATAHGPQ